MTEKTKVVIDDEGNKHFIEVKGNDNAEGNVVITPGRPPQLSRNPSRRFDIVQQEFNNEVARANFLSHEYYVANRDENKAYNFTMTPDEAWGLVADLAQELGALSLTHGKRK